MFPSSADAPRPDCRDPLSAPGIIARCDSCFTHFRGVRIASPPCMLCLGHTRAERKTQPPGAQDLQNIHSLLPTWPLLPWRGNGNGDGPGGTAKAAARGGTRQWRRGGRGDGDRAGRTGSAAAVDLCCGRYDICGRESSSRAKNSRIPNKNYYLRIRVINYDSNQVSDWTSTLARLDCTPLLCWMPPSLLLLKICY